MVHKLSVVGQLVANFAPQRQASGWDIVNQMNKNKLALAVSVVERTGCMSSSRDTCDLQNIISAPQEKTAEQNLDGLRWSESLTKPFTKPLTHV